MKSSILLKKHFKVLYINYVKKIQSLSVICWKFKLLSTFWSNPFLSNLRKSITKFKVFGVAQDPCITFPVTQHLNRKSTICHTNWLTLLATSLRHTTPLWKSGNTMEPYFLHSGMGRIFSVTSVTTPKVPAQKYMSCMFTFSVLHVSVQGIQSADSIHAINLLKSGMFTINTVWTYWNVLSKM